MSQQPFDEAAINANRAALRAHIRDLRSADMLGPESSAKSHLYPGTDSIAVYRNGPKNTKSSVVDVTIIDGGRKAQVTLSVTDARRIGMALLDAADEADGTARLEFTVGDKTGGES